MMRINKWVFPFLLLLVFFGVIALGVVAGYWDSRGGGGRHQLVAPTPAVEIDEGMVVTWQS